MGCKHLNYVKENSFIWKNHKAVNFNMECLIFDTESCQKIKGDNTGAKVYGWGLGCTRTHNMLYGQNIKQFMFTLNNLFDNYYKKNIKNIKPKKVKGKYESEKFIKIPCAIHNLGWDVEFFKYELPNLGFNYQKGKLVQTFSKGKLQTSCKDVEMENTFHIVQNDNIVYGCTIYFPFTQEFINKDGSRTKIGLCLDMFDSYKIISCKEEHFNDYVTNVNNMFFKIVGKYDYKKYREEGHIQTDFELRYQYNDIFMLRETIEQFYIDGLCGGVIPQIGKRTASSIAFDKLKKMTFGENKTEELYQSYFEIDQTTTFELTRKRIEKASYSGGFTHANAMYVEKFIKNYGCSLDINSSYPSQMAYKKFPYGKPKQGDYGKVPQEEENKLFLIEVGFDYVKPKQEKFNLPIFKIGASNIKALKPIVGNVSGQEYFATNIKNNKIIPIIKELDNTFLKAKYQIVLTEVEYKFWVKHYDFGYYKYDELGFAIEEEKINFNGLEIGEVLIYKAEVGKFRNFVEYFTKMKVDNKPKYENGVMVWGGNNSLSNQAKLFLNSSYGKFGTRQDRIEMDMVMDKHGIYTFTKENSEEYEGKEYYRPYASFVTAYGRLQLWNAIIYAVGVDKFLYCDTDSIYCLRDVKTLTIDMNKIGETIDKTQLGKWDIENEFDMFKVLGQKKYMYHNHIKNKTSLKCCGLPSVAQELLTSKAWEVKKTNLVPVNFKTGKVEKKYRTLEQIFDGFHLGKDVKGKLQRQKVIGGCLLLDTLFQIKKIMW